MGLTILLLRSLMPLGDMELRLCTSCEATAGTSLAVLPQYQVTQTSRPMDFKKGHSLGSSGKPKLDAAQAHVEQDDRVCRLQDDANDAKVKQALG
mmetsp:Transcript_10381/g.27467  ORF Transcript_10381/g.27467 Transcript_10381/m.27467 type:complete len:95 (-) Transcript_10381:283-567(-)